jgi:hypothetical protein
MRPLLDFDDAGAQDDHPARGVTCGDIRAWHDEIERLTQALQDVLNPLGKIVRAAEARNAELSGQAYGIANSLSYVQGIARDALSSQKRGT